MAHPKLKHTDAVIYRTASNKGAFILGAGILLVPFSLIASTPLSMTKLVVMIPLAFLCSYTIWIIYQVTRGSVLILGSEGLEYRFGNWSLFSSWDNLSHFVHQASGRRTLHGIQLRTPIKQTVDSGRIDKMLLFNNAERDYIPIPKELTILPLHQLHPSYRIEVDTTAFAQTSLGQDLLHYAPHLFENEKGKRA